MSRVSSSEVGFPFPASLLPFPPSLHCRSCLGTAIVLNAAGTVLLRSDPLVGLNILWTVFPLIRQTFGLLGLFAFGSVSSILDPTLHFSPPLPSVAPVRVLGLPLALNAAGTVWLRSACWSQNPQDSVSPGRTSLRLVVLVCSLVLSPRSSNCTLTPSPSSHFLVFDRAPRRTYTQKQTGDEIYLWEQL